LLNLDIGLPVERLRPLLKTSLGGDGGRQILTLESVNRRGKPIQCDVTCSPLRGPNGEVRGAIVLMEESGDGRP
jgi:two-component system, chemotaxis family, CheB/CheR fusion protein